MGIVGSQIKAKRVFSIIGIYTNLKHSWLGMDNLEMLINTYKNWIGDACVGGFPSMEKFMKMEKTLMKENKDVIASLGLLDLEDNNNRLLVDFFFSSLMLMFVKVEVDAFNLLFLVVISLGVRLEWPCPENISKLLY